MKKEYKESVDAFLRLKNIVIAGYSTDKSQPANHIYKRFSDNGYNVFAVNPKASSINDLQCYNSLSDISEPIEGVVICTPVSATLSVVEECILNDVKHVWIHRSFDNGSYNKEAVDLCKQNGINCISVGCPLMFLNSDFAHKCMRWIMNASGKFKS